MRKVILIRLHNTVFGVYVLEVENEL